MPQAAGFVDGGSAGVVSQRLIEEALTPSPRRRERGEKPHFQDAKRELKEARGMVESEFSQVRAHPLPTPDCRS